MTLIKHSSMKKSELRQILDATEDPRYKALFRFLSETGRRITEVIGDQEYIDALPGLRPLDIIKGDDGGYVARYYILKKDAARKKYTEIKRKFFERYENTPETRSKWQNKLKEIRRRSHTYHQTEIPISDNMVALLVNISKKYGMSRKDRFFPFLYHQCRYRFEKACAAAQVYYSTSPRPTKDQKKDGTLYHIHQLRHYYATQIARNTKNVSQLFQLKKLMQHADISVTQYYVDADDTEARALQQETFGAK